MAPLEAKIEANGRVLLPAAVRERLGVKPGDALLMDVGEHGVRLYTRRHALRALQELAQRSNASGPDAIDDFLAWRREDDSARQSRLDRVAGKARAKR